MSHLLYSGTVWMNVHVGTNQPSPSQLNHNDFPLSVLKPKFDYGMLKRFRLNEWLANSEKPFLS